MISTVGFFKIQELQLSLEPLDPKKSLLEICLTLESDIATAAFLAPCAAVDTLGRFILPAPGARKAGASMSPENMLIPSLLFYTVADSSLVKIK